MGGRGRRGDAAGGLDGRVGGEVGHRNDEAANVEVGCHLVDDTDCKVEVSDGVEQEVDVNCRGGGEDGVAENAVERAQEEGQQELGEVRGVELAHAVNDDTAHKVRDNEAQHGEIDVRVY